MLALTIFFLLSMTGWSNAQTPVDLELVLAVDSSASVDTREFSLQVSGMSRGMRDPNVLGAIFSGPYKSIAVTVIEWASEDLQLVNVPWMLIDGPVAAGRLADLLETMPRRIGNGATSISGAIRFAASLFQSNGFVGLRKVIDLSCDGRNNQGPVVEVMRDVLVSQGFTINGLTILNEHPTLNYYFKQRIIGGPGAFVEIAQDYEDYAEAFLRKLVREIRNVPIGSIPPAYSILRFVDSRPTRH